MFSTISIGAHQVRILLFHVDFRIELREVPEQTLENWVCWVIACGNAKVDCQLLRWVVLLKGSSQTFVEVRLDAFHRPNNGHMRNVRKREEARYWLRRGSQVQSPSKQWLASAPKIEMNSWVKVQLNDTDELDNEDEDVPTQADDGYQFQQHRYTILLTASGAFWALPVWVKAMSKL